MLCLSLAPMEKLYAGNDVVFVNRTNTRINIGIEAPKHVKVLRGSRKEKDEKKEPRK